MSFSSLTSFCSLSFSRSRVVQEMSSAERSGAPSVSPSDYLLEINKVLLTMADNELLLNSSELSGGLYEDFSSQEDTLRVSGHSYTQPVKGPNQCSYMSLSFVNIGHIGYTSPTHFSQSSFICEIIDICLFKFCPCSVKVTENV